MDAGHVSENALYYNFIVLNSEDKLFYQPLFPGQFLETSVSPVSA